MASWPPILEDAIIVPLLELLLWRGLEHLLCCRTILRKWPTFQMRRRGWPALTYPREHNALHMYELDLIEWHFQYDPELSAEWCDSHYPALRSAMHQAYSGLAFLGIMAKLARVNHKWYQNCCQWVSTAGDIPLFEFQLGDPNRRLLHQLPDPLPSTWPLQLEVLRECPPQGMRHMRHGLPDFPFLGDGDRRAMQLVMPILLAKTFKPSEPLVNWDHVPISTVRLTNHWEWFGGTYLVTPMWVEKIVHIPIRDLMSWSMFEQFFWHSEPVPDLFPHQNAHNIQFWRYE